MLHTFYDDLGVSHLASAEVIRAAYRVLSKKYHPDHHPGDASSHDLMVKINAAYAVLSDDQKRRDYDLWLARQKLQAPIIGSSGESQWSDDSIALQKHVPVLPNTRAGGVTLAVPNKSWLWFIIVPVFVAMAFMWWQFSLLKAEVEPINAETVAIAPNGQTFPIKAAYVSGYPVLNNQGKNIIKVDASGLNTAIFAQLYELRNQKFTAIRSFYLPAGEVFALSDLGDGEFNLQYQRIDNAQWQVSDTIQIKHTERSRQSQEVNIQL